MIKKFRKKPVEIEAVRFTDENKEDVLKWAKNMQYDVWEDWEDRNKQQGPIIKIPTLEGIMICSIGDYIIVEPFPTNHRKLYPCKPDIFKKTYEEVK